MATKTIEVPMAGSLEQKTDSLQSNNPETVLNLVRTKLGSLRKRTGLDQLPSTTRINRGQVSGQWAVTPVGGRRMFARRGRPYAVINDAFKDLIVGYDEAQTVWYGHGRLPEVAISPFDLIAAPSPWFLVTGPLPITQIDMAANTGGYECVVWADPNLSTAGASAPTIWALIRHQATGERIGPVQQLSPGAGGPAAMIRVIACGTVFILAWSGASNTSIRAATFDTSNIATGWSSFSSINGSAADSVVNGAYSPNPFDITPVVGDVTRFGLIYEATRAGTRTIRVIVYTTAFALVSDTAIDANDATWTTDNGVSAAASALSACALRVDSGVGEVAYAYAWRNTTPLTRVSCGIFNYPGMTAKATALNLMSSVNGSMSASTDGSPRLVTLERVQSGFNANNYVVRMSPGSNSAGMPAYDQQVGGTANPVPYIASWQVQQSAGAVAFINAQGARQTTGVMLASRDVVVNGLSYLVGALISSTQGSMFLYADDVWKDPSSSAASGSGPYGGFASYTPLRLVGSLAVRLQSPMSPAGSAPTLMTPMHIVSAANAPGAQSAFRTCVPIALSANALGVAVYTLEFNSQQTHQSAELGGAVILASGSPQSFDGRRPIDIAFSAYPVIQNALQAGAGSLTPSSTYSYLAVFEWQDAMGVRHRSARSVPRTVTLDGAHNAATVTILPVLPSSKWLIPDSVSSAPGFDPEGGLESGDQPMVIKLYRTQAGGTTYYNVVAGDGPIAFAGTGNASTISYTDLLADTVLASHTKVYGDGTDGTTPGNILDNLCPPSFQGVITHQNRIFGVDGPRVWPSKVLTAGEGPGFNEATLFSVDDGPGDLTALASIDDKLILFKSDRVLYMTGLGPADNGTQNDWSPPTRIASDTGCNDWRSVVVTPRGVLFQSADGRRMLTRDLQVVPVTNVETFDQAQPTTVAALLHPTTGRAVFVQNTDDFSNPRLGGLVLRDYVTDTWSTAQYNDGARANRGWVSGVIADAQSSAGPPAVMRPVLYLLREDGLVMREATNGSSLDAGGFVAYTWTSPWIKSDGLVGFSNWSLVRLFLQKLDNAQVTVTIAYDYPGSPLASTVRTFTTAQIVSSQVLPGLIEIRPEKTRAAALQITVTDNVDTGTNTGAGFSLQAVRVDYDVEPGGYRAGATQRG